MDKIKGCYYDCILMDAFMPLMDGVEATKKIRKQEQITGGHIPIIAITADALSGSRSKYLDAGMDAYLTKPVQFNKLVMVLYEIVENFGIRTDNMREALIDKD